MRSKTIGIGITILGVATLLLVSGNRTQAFHSGGVAECGGCHSMHNPKAGGSFLLLGIDQSSTCLNCHQSEGDTGPRSYHISTAEADMPAGTAPLQRSPGGDFGWLKKTYTWTGRHGPETEEGDSHGHNVIATDYSYAVDGEHTMSPGGDVFASSQLGCQSCHDPHGQLRRLTDGSYARGGVLGVATAPIISSGSYNTSPDPGAGEAVGAYRLLRGDGDASQGVTFVGVPIAVAPSGYNKKELTAADQVRVAYGATGIDTWGNWCATCHPDNHSSGNYVHPVDQSLTTGIANIYNAYKMSGDLTGTSADSFTSLVPFAENTDDITVLKSHANSDGSYLNGPGSSDKVTCLTCHRAHASGWPEALRWNMEGEFMVYDGLWPGTDTLTDANKSRGRLSAETQAAYYDRPTTMFATYQRVLCNKCHAKD
jgi:hypothetical protein